MKQIDELIERLEKATGPDRELDEAIIAWSQGAERVEDATFDHKHGYARDGFWVSIGPIHPVTASIDAAVALVERRFSAPEHFVELSIGKAAYCEIHSQSVYDELGKGEAATAPNAILIALLRATEPSNGGTA